MKRLARHFLTKQERELVRRAVHRAESQTSGEIVPMIVSASYDYPKAFLAAALLCSLPLALLLAHLLGRYLWLDGDNVYFVLTLLIPLFLLGHRLVDRFPALARPFISEEEMALEVEEEAVNSFFREKLYLTREANGILLFISVFERRAWILADHGIEDVVADDTWDELIRELTGRLRTGRQRGDALCDAITRVGAILQHHFPSRRDDSNELHDLIIK